MKIEKRVYKFEKLDVEERADGLGPKITGYAAVFNSLSDDLGGFREKIKPGAFKKALKNSDVRGLFNHDSNYVLGRQSNGTLRISEDKNGLFMEIDPPDTQIIRDLVLAPIKRGDIKEQSFGFIIEKDEWEGLDDDKETKEIIRTILEIRELFDVSPVTFPAYPDTSVALRSLEKAKELPFTPVENVEVLSSELDLYIKNNDAGHRSLSAFKIVEILIPALTEEQRKKLLPAAEPDKKDQGLDADKKGGGDKDVRSTPVENRNDPKEIDKRFKEIFTSV